MVKLLIGNAGSGKTKLMLEKANKDVENIRGTLVYIENTNKHMHLLHRDVRFICTEDLDLTSFSSMYGFVCGLNSANYDIEEIYIDGLYKIVTNPIEELACFLDKMNEISEKYNTEIIISCTMDEDKVPADVKKYVVEE